MEDNKKYEYNWVCNQITEIAAFDIVSEDVGHRDLRALHFAHKICKDERGEIPTSDKKYCGYRIGNLVRSVDEDQTYLILCFDGKFRIAIEKNITWI